MISSSTVLWSPVQISAICNDLIGLNFIISKCYMNLLQVPGSRHFIRTVRFFDFYCPFLPLLCLFWAAFIRIKGRVFLGDPNPATLQARGYINAPAAHQNLNLSGRLKVPQTRFTKSSPSSAVTSRFCNAWDQSKITIITRIALLKYLKNFMVKSLSWKSLKYRAIRP